MSAHTYPTRALGANGPLVSAIGFGAMGMGQFYGAIEEEEFHKTLTYAADRGVTFWDTADMYGNSEESIGNWFAKTGRRSDIFLCTKFGAWDRELGLFSGANNKPSYVRQSVEHALSVLQTTYIDCIYLHRVDPAVPIEISLEALRPYVEEGKIRYIGISECSLDVLKRAKRIPVVGEKVVAAQMEFSPFELAIERSGFLDGARELGVSVVAYSPLGRGLMSGKYKSRDDLPPDDARIAYDFPRFRAENFSKNIEVTHKFAEVGVKYNATPAQIALAWMLAEHPTLIPIPGSRSVAHLEDNAKSAEISLSAEDLKALRHIVDYADVKGDRYRDPPNTECIPLSEWKGEA